MERIFTVQEAADYLKVRPETIRRLLSQGRLPGNKVGRAWRIPENALMAFLRGGGMGAVEEVTQRRGNGHGPYRQSLEA